MERRKEGRSWFGWIVRYGNYSTPVELPGGDIPPTGILPSVAIISARMSSTFYFSLASLLKED